MKWSNTCTQQGADLNIQSQLLNKKNQLPRRTQDPDSPPLGRPYLGWHRPFCTLSVDCFCWHPKKIWWNNEFRDWMLFLVFGHYLSLEWVQLNFLRCFLCVCHGPWFIQIFQISPSQGTHWSSTCTKRWSFQHPPSPASRTGSSGPLQQEVRHDPSRDLMILTKTW